MSRFRQLFLIKCADLRYQNAKVCDRLSACLTESIGNEAFNELSSLSRYSLRGARDHKYLFSLGTMAFRAVKRLSELTKTSSLNSAACNGLFTRGLSSTSGQEITATLFPGDGIGPEISAAVKEV